MAQKISHESISRHKRVVRFFVSDIDLPMIESNPIMAIIVHELLIVYIEPGSRRIPHRNFLLRDFLGKDRRKGTHFLGLVSRPVSSSTHREVYHRVFRLAAGRNRTCVCPLLVFVRV